MSLLKRIKAALVLGCVLLSMSLSASDVGAVISITKEKDAVELQCAGKQKVRLSFVANDIIRVQVAPQGKFEKSSMVTYGFVKEKLELVNYTVVEEDSYYQLSTDALAIQIDKEQFRFKVFDKSGNLITQNDKAYQLENGNSLNFTMPADEHFFGFGFMRNTLDARGQVIHFQRKYRWKEATVPFFMSTRGYAFYSNSVFNQVFDFTPKSDGGVNDYYTVKSNDENIDFYLIYGPDFPKLLDRYTDLTGKSMLVPKWAFGLEYRLRYYGDQNELLSVAKEFRNKEIPSDIMALEPGWEEVSYSMKWKWSPERFPNPKKMIDELGDMGFKLDLWESGIAPVENITDEKVRKQWYDKRKNIVDMGVRMFKQDDPYPRSIISTELSDPVLASNRNLKDKVLTAEELNNVANSLYTQTVFNEFSKQTGERAVVMFHAYNASVASQRWPFQWAGDFQAENGMLNASLSGHAMVSYDIRNPYAAGWHQGFFTPFTVVDAWAYYREPWLYSESIEQSHRLYACLRSRLVPYFYSSLWQSHTTGLPIERPMVLNYHDDPITHQMKSQFMVGDWFLLALSDVDDSPSGEKIDFWTGVQKGNHGRAYLPKGKWINYWSGKEENIESAKWVYDEWPEYLGGLLYVKAGAIIPMGQVKNYIDETPDDILVLDVYPCQESSYQLYEDDGHTYNYEKGELALTDIQCKQAGNDVKLAISTRQGSYKGMPGKRSYLVKMHSLISPVEVKVDGEKVASFSNLKDLIYNESSKGWYYDAASKKTIIKLDKGWKYESADSDVNPAATLPLTAKNERVFLTNDAQFADTNREIDVRYPEKAVVQFATNIAGLPADGMSLAKVSLNFKNKKEEIGMLNCKIEGSASFGNGTNEHSIDAASGYAFEIMAGEKPGNGKLLIDGENVETSVFEFPIYGHPSQLRVEKVDHTLIADGVNVFELKAKLFDESGHHVLQVKSPIIVNINGPGVFQNMCKSDTIRPINGEAIILLQSTTDPGEIVVSANWKNIQGNATKIDSKKGVMQVRINPPEKIKLDSDGGWIPDQVDVFVNFKAGDEWVKTINNKVTLNVYNKKNELLDTYVQDAKNGEVIFKDITYYKRPAQCLFEIECNGYETVTRKVFANTWNK